MLKFRYSFQFPLAVYNNYRAIIYIRCEARFGCKTAHLPQSHRQIFEAGGHLSKTVTETVQSCVNCYIIRRFVCFYYSLLILILN
jgi:hypothetical protein